MNKSQKDMVRINTRIGKTAHEWLEKESEETGVPKSTLVHLALENYIQQKQALKTMADISQLVEKLEQVEQAVKDIRNG